MLRQSYPLPEFTVGIACHLTTHSFGSCDSGKKVYVQAGLHADEFPGMLVALTLREHLQRLEDAGQLRCEVVVATAANPLGLSQWMHGTPIGRFDLATGRNFNRNFPLLSEPIAAAVATQLGDDPAANLLVIRRAWRAALKALHPTTLIEALQQLLMLLACDADVVLDLHCSREAAVHVYTGEAIWPEIEPLARYLGAAASLLAYDAGGQSFDEAHSLTWWQLRQHFAGRFPVPAGAIAATIEHRGRRDVTYEAARQDAQAIIHYLTQQGYIDGVAPPLPELVQGATPLSGSEQFYAPTTGLLVHRADIGALIEVGQPLFDVVRLDDGTAITVSSSTRGRLYMRRDERFVKAGDPLGRVTGVTPQRSGMLLSA